MGGGPSTQLGQSENLVFKHWSYMLQSFIYIIGSNSGPAVPFVTCHFQNNYSTIMMTTGLRMKYYLY